MRVKDFGGVEEDEKGMLEFSKRKEPALRKGKANVMVGARKELWRVMKKALRLLMYV